MSDNFNLQNYETVKERKARFYANNPEGSIIVDLIHHEADHAVFRASCYKTKDDQRAGLPTSTGHAEEFKGVGGFANKFSWLENCEESAVGRALDNMGYSGNGKCSREEMLKVQNAEAQQSPEAIADQVKKVMADMESAPDVATLKKTALSIAKMKARLTEEQTIQLREVYDATLERLS